MKTKLIQLENKIKELEILADEILILAEKLSKGENVQPDFSTKIQKWYRSSREIMLQNNFSGLKDFEYCYNTSDNERRRSFTDIEQYSEKGTNPYGDKKIWTTDQQGEENFGLFSRYFQKARSLLLAVVDEVMSRELPIVSQLSFNLATDEFDTAKSIIESNPEDETSLRVSGFITRIALERHLLTVADSKDIEIIKNPSSKKNHDTNDILTTLEKSGVITQIQKSELESLFKVGNNCAHPKESVNFEDVKRLIERSRELASIIL